MKKDNQRVDKSLIGISLVVVISVVIFLYTFPEKSEAVAQLIFTTLTDIFGSFVLLFAFLGTIFLFG